MFYHYFLLYWRKLYAQPYPMINIVGRLAISGTPTFFHCPTLRVTINSSGEVISHATVKSVSAAQTCNICSISFTLRYGASMKICDCRS